MDIVFHPIGYIHSPYKENKEAPRQGVMDLDTTAVLELLPAFAEGARDIEAGSYGMIFFYFHQSHDYDLVTIARGIMEERGVFSTRSPRRPNGIGLSIVKFTKVEGNGLEFSGVDMLDGTPVLDIKPYNESFNPKMT